MASRQATWILGAAALLWVSGAEAGELTLKRVLLSSGGVGLYEYEADVEGDATVEWKAPLDQIDDILKSLVVFDDQGGVGGLDLPGPKPLADAFRGLPFQLKDLQSTPQLLAALRGAEVEIGGARVLKGRIVAIGEESEVRPDGGALKTRHRVSVMTEAGLRQFVLEEADSVQFTDPALRDALAKALQAVASDAERGSRTLRLTTKGAGARTLHVAYLASAPVWKVAYRLVLNKAADAKTATLQGWATLENLSGQDWRNVELTLVSGRPVAYRQALYRAYRVERPEAPLDFGAQLNPEVDRGALAAPVAAAPFGGVMAKTRSAPMLAEAMQKPLSAAAESAAIEEGETAVAFRLPYPVSLADGRTFSAPIVDAEAPAARVAIFDRNDDPRHPLSAAELTNATKATLPPGIVTIYERSDDGATYVGDSRLSVTPAGEKRLLRYALDPKTTIEEDDSDSASLARARIAKGVLTLDDLTRRRTLYRVKADEPRQLIVFAPKLAGGKTTEPTSGVSEADGALRASFAVKPGEQSFSLTQQLTQTRAVALASLDDAALAVYAKSGAIDSETRASLEKLAVLRAAEVEAARALEAAQRQADAVVADQTRLRNLLGAVSAGSDLQKRYLGKLDADESALESARSAIAARTAARDAARSAVEAFVAGE